MVLKKGFWGQVSDGFLVDFVCFNIVHTVLSEMPNRLESVFTMIDLVYPFSIHISSNSLQTVNR